MSNKPKPKPKPKPRIKPKPTSRSKEDRDGGEPAAPQDIANSEDVVTTESSKPGNGDIAKFAAAKKPPITSSTAGNVSKRPAKRKPASPKPNPKPVSRQRPAERENRAKAATSPDSTTTSVSTDKLPEDAGDALDDGGAGSFLLFTAMPSWLTSTMVHVIVLLTLAIMTLPAITRPNRDNEIVLGDDNDVVEDLEEFQDQAMDSVELDSMEVSDILVDSTEEIITEDPIISPAMDMSAAQLKMDLNPLSLTSIRSSDLGQAIGVSGGDALSGRGSSSRARMVREGGGTPGSEAAVALALQWLKNHQMSDGGWSIDHKRSPTCQGRCPDIGKKTKARNGATALALLPFLGSGQTHMEGQYRDVVDRGLKYLLRHMRGNGARSSLVEQEGTYYSHGLGAIVICESYAMTRDKMLMVPAQALINEIVYAQDPIGGGWRYNPGQPGDTSVVGWQLMALKSAHMGYLNVPKQTIEGANRFLDTVQTKKGANYGYAEPSEKWRYSTTSVGLLCRMYLGWKKQHPAIVAGVEKLAEKGPDDNDIYYNYYATQVMRHYGGDTWKAWNETMRDQLVNSQEKEGHQAGSWFFDGGHANESGGRLYTTSMATMILEVYYRHLPLYQQEASEDEFPL